MTSIHTAGLSSTLFAERSETAFGEPCDTDDPIGMLYRSCLVQAIVPAFEVIEAID
jgi:hypothetical protein